MPGITLDSQQGFPAQFYRWNSSIWLPKPFSRSVFLKVWSINHHYQHCLGCLWNTNISGPYLRLSESESLEVGPEIYMFNRCSYHCSTLYMVLPLCGILFPCPCLWNSCPFLKAQFKWYLVKEATLKPFPSFPHDKLAMGWGTWGHQNWDSGKSQEN